MADDSWFGGGLGGLGGSMNDFLTNPLTLMSLQMMSNNTPRVGQPVNTLEGVPNILLTAGLKKQQRDDEKKAQQDLEKLLGQMGGGSDQIAEPPKPMRSAEPDVTPPDVTPDEAPAPNAAAAKPTVVQNDWLKALEQNYVKNNGQGITADLAPTAQPAQPAQPEYAPDTKTAQVLAARAAAAEAKAGKSAAPSEGPEEFNVETLRAQQAQRLAAGEKPEEQLSWLKLPEGLAERRPAPAEQPAQQTMEQRGVPQASAQTMEQRGVPQASAQPVAQGAPPNPGFTPPPQVVAQQPAPQPTVTDQARAVYAQNQAIAPARTPAGQNVDPRLLSSVIANKRIDPAIKSHILKQLAPAEGNFGFQHLPDGSVIRTDPKRGTADLVYQGGTKPMKPEWKETGRVDPYTGAKEMGWINPADQSVKPYKPEGEAEGKSVEATVDKIRTLRDEGKSQDEIIDAAVPKGFQSYMKGLLRGDADPAKLGRLQGEAKRNLLNLAHEIDPNFKEEQIALRATFAKNMASGAPNSWGSQVRGSGTIVKHIGSGLDNLDVVEKGAKGVPGGEYGEIAELNRARAYVNQRATDKEYNKAAGAYDVDKEAVAGEVVRLLTGGQGSEKDRAEWRDKLDYTKRPMASVRGAWNEAFSIMYGRLEKVAEQKDTAYGTETDPITLLGKGGSEAAERIRQQGAAPGTHGAPRISTPEEYNKLSKGQKYTDPDGNLRTKQ